MARMNPGALYVGAGRRYVDSQGLRNIAHTHEVVEAQGGGWRILGAGGVVSCALLGGRPPLPEQRGSLYEVAAEPGVLVPMAKAWVERGQVSVYDAPAQWHTPARASCRGCGSTCGCGPCQHKHGQASQSHEHESRPPASQQTPERKEPDDLNQQFARRYREHEREVVGTFDRLLRIYSGGRIGASASTDGTLTIQRVQGTSEFPTLALPNVVEIAEAAPLGTILARVRLSTHEVVGRIELPIRGHALSLQYTLTRTMRDAWASVFSRWIRPPTDHIEAGGGAWDTDLYLPLRKNHTCEQCPFVLGSNLDCRTCRDWILGQKVNPHVWTPAEIFEAIKPYCPAPQFAEAGAVALARTAAAPLTPEFFAEWAAAFGHPLGDTTKDTGFSQHCRRCIELLLIIPDFALPNQKARR